MVRKIGHHDEPEILHYAITAICPICAVVGHLKLSAPKHRLAVKQLHGIWDIGMVLALSAVTFATNAALLVLISCPADD
ncbi:hypothetical protein MTBLM1_120056 [Rhodospirillaceae bacterium LM-1]|nr:hypothetical protein MTBLM1_120056 [Rhodospirillaceae bacterium LM-1]